MNLVRRNDLAMETSVRRLLTVVFADMVGYSTLTALDESGTHRMWRRFVTECVEPVIERHRGKLIRTLGDGVLATFESSVDGVDACVALQLAVFEDRAQEVPGWPGLKLRIGANLCEAIVESGDVYGDAVNLAKRLQEYANPDSTVISAALADAAGHGTGSTFRRLGAVRLPKSNVTVQAVEVLADGVAKMAATAPGGTLPSIAVLPLADRSDVDGFQYFADGVVEDIIVSLSGLKELFVISRGSTLVLGREPRDPADIGRVLGVRYVLSGSIRRSAHRLRLVMELSDTQSGETLFVERRDVSHSEVFEVQDTIVERIVSRIAPNVRSSERMKALRKPPESFSAYDMTLKALGIMEKLDRQTFPEGRVLLGEAMRIDPNFAMPAAYAVRWHCINVGQGWSADPNAEMESALAMAERAVEIDRQNALALAYFAHVKSFLQREYQTALVYLDRAREVGPSHAMAWVLSSGTHAYMGEPDKAIVYAERALALSPHDPDLYIFYDFLAIALLVAGRLEESATWSRRSVSENPRYKSGLLTALVSHYAVGDTEAGALFTEQFLALDPGFQVSSYFRDRCPHASQQMRMLLRTHLEAAGVPA